MAAKQKYDERFVKIAKVLCMRGGTDEDLADALEVSPRTTVGKRITRSLQRLWPPEKNMQMQKSN